MLRILLVGAGASFSTRDVEDGYLAALRARSDVQVHYYALEPRLGLARDWLHKLWRARGKPPDQRPSWPDTIYRASVEAFEMALRYDVDWVFVISGMYFHPDVLELLHRARLRTCVLLTESPYEDAAQARLAALVDVVWTTERTSAQPLGAGYVRHAYDPLRHHPDALDFEKTPAHDVVFVGTGFQERIAELAAVDWTGIDLGLYGNWSLLGSRHPLRNYLRSGPVSNDVAVQLYRRARIGLNLYRTSQTYGRAGEHVAGAQSLNPRAYELAACGVFQVSDYRAESDETFGDSVPTFTPGHLEDTLRAYLLDSPARRYAARQAREKVAPHTFAARAAQLVADLDAYDDRSLRKGA
ncbi:MAG TPA: glycosyltransferase [Chloroflexota bacterium]|nr:glycosyltransferase [Chloroflexota bacterium]